MNPISLTERADIVVQQSPELSGIRQVIEKELVHYDILFLLQQKRLMTPDSALIGGSSLRYCHGSTRYSEDLYFHVGASFDNKKFDKLIFEAEQYLKKRYGLEVETKSPMQSGKDSKNFNQSALTWKIIVYTQGGPAKSKSQRIHIDVANFPTYDVKLRLIQPHYSILPDGYNAMLFKSSSQTEILADKLLAVPNRNRIKARELWDVAWLLQRRTPVDTGMLRLKIADHNIKDYKSALEKRIELMPAYFESGEYEKEMVRFLNMNDYTNTVKRQEFIDVLRDLIIETLSELHSSLYSTSKT